MIERVGAGAQAGVVATTALRYAQNGQQVVMPVRPAELIYANFTHIQVRPDTRLENGVPLYKLRILDTLIDRYARGDAPGTSGASALAGARGSGESLDRLITRIAGELRSGANPYRVGFLPLPGAFVDLVA